MIRVFTLFSLLFIFSSKVIGSEFYWMRTSTKDWKKSDRSDFLNGRLEGKVLNSLDSIYSKNPHHYFFFYNGEELQSYVSCGFDLYSINETSLQLKYNYFNKGYTCYTTPFVKDETNYLLGGHGFWTNHLDLLRFDEIHGSWELMKTTNQPLDYFYSGVFQNSKGIFSLFGYRDNIRIGLSEVVPNGYFLDWESKEWKEIEVQIEGIDNTELVSTGNLKFLETKDYLFMVSRMELKNVGWNIIEKESGKIYFFDDLKNNDLFYSTFIEVIGNTINYQSPNGTPKSLDLEYLLTQSKEVGSIIIKEGSMEGIREFPIRDRFYIITIILLILFLVNVYVRKKPIPTLSLNNNGNEEMEKIIKTFSQYSSLLLTSEELDEVLGIDSVGNNDSKRLKRSRWVNKLNEYYNSQNGKDLIQRDKNPEDKRYIYYKVNSSDPKLNKP
jgi:hypothetical protein